MTANNIYRVTGPLTLTDDNGVPLDENDPDVFVSEELRGALVELIEDLGDGDSVVQLLDGSLSQFISSASLTPASEEVAA